MPGRSSVWRGALLAAVLVLLSAARSAHAQVAVEAGGYVGGGCIAAESQHCETNSGAIFGAYGGVRFQDRIAVQARYLSLSLADRVDDFGPFVERRYDHGVSLLVGELAYYFQKGHEVRPFLGASFGLRSERLTTRCEPVSCAETWIGTFSGRTRQSDGGVIGGLSYEPLNRLRVQGLIGLHTAAGGGTIEGGVLVGIRLWRSR